MFSSSKTVVIDSDLYKQIKLDAFKNGLTINKYTNEYLRLFLEKKKIVTENGGEHQ